MADYNFLRLVKVHTPNHREEKMSVEEEYYINLHVGGKFVHDPHVKYLGGKMVRLKEYPGTMLYFELCKIVKDGLGFNTVQLIYFHVLGSRTL